MKRSLGSVVQSLLTAALFSVALFGLAQVASASDDCVFTDPGYCPSPIPCEAFCGGEEGKCDLETSCCICVEET